MPTTPATEAGSSPKRRPSAPASPLGTFAGVFTPSVLTILGIILFLRLGFVVGAAGTTRGLLIIVLANTISVLTSISLAAIATNLRVKAGGDYYLISRTLGVGFGGALGLVLFLAQSVSIAFYLIGFGEAVAIVLPGSAPWTGQAIAAGALVPLFVLAWFGSDWATKFQYVVMAVLGLGIAAFFVGGIAGFEPAQFAANAAPASSLSFWALFAIFFPAVTGFTQGVSMSGDLKDPGRSLPTGTFLAVAVSLLVYVAAAVVFAGALPGAELASDYGAMRRIASVPWLIDAGVFAATLSSALASFLGAPRILQSLAADKVFPFLNFFALGHGPANNPRRGVLLAAGIAVATIALGNLNLIAPIISMFFLISYGLLNYATYYEASTNSPSFRPTFRYFDRRLSLVGALACLGAMMALDFKAGLIAVAVLFGLFEYVARTVRIERWADSARSKRLQSVRTELYALDRHLEHDRDWRPVVLAFSDDPERRGRLLRFARWIDGDAGFTTVVRLLRGSGAVARRRADDAEAELEAEVRANGGKAFARVVTAETIRAGLKVLLQSHGIGPIRANTVLVNYRLGAWDPMGIGRRALGASLHDSIRFGCNVILLTIDAEAAKRIDETADEERTIDIWHSDDASGRLMLLYAYLMTRHSDWRRARLRLLAATDPESKDDIELKAELTNQLESSRISAEVVLVDGGFEGLVAASRASSMAFVPFRISKDEPCLRDGSPLSNLVGSVGALALTLAAQDIALDAEPEDGTHAELASTMDLAAAAEDAADRAEADLAAARAQLAKLGDDDEARARLGSEVDKLNKRAARSRAKADAALSAMRAVLGEEGDGPA